MEKVKVGILGTGQLSLMMAQANQASDITDIEFIYAEALAFGEEAAEASLQQAREQIAALTL